MAKTTEALFSLLFTYLSTTVVFLLFVAGSVDSGISPGSSPHGKKLSKLQFNVEGRTFADKHNLIDAMLDWIRETKVHNTPFLV